LKLVKFVFLGLLTTIVTVGFISRTVWSEEEAVLYIEPSSFLGTTYKPGINITFYVKVTNVTNLKSLAFNLNYSQEVLRPILAVNLEMPKNIETSLWGGHPGYLWFNLSYKTPITTDVPLALVNVTLLVHDRGETIIDLQDTVLLDGGGAFILHMAMNGYFNNFNPYDLDRDGRVDVSDVAIVGAAFGSYEGHPRWNPIADVDGDGQVTIIDMALVAEHFGEY